jgi:lipid-A-disaccharide synthase
MRIFFSVGEPSGDIHAANLIRALRQRAPNIECVGYGGPKMAAAGCKLHADLTQLAVMWILEALLNFHRFWRLLRLADRYFATQKPDAVVLVDFPGFNWWIARRAKARGITVFYYSPPQVWAWLRFRVRKLRRLADHVLCGLPFEAAWLRRHGCNATLVGHPFFDEVQRAGESVGMWKRESDVSGDQIVTLLPGSRTAEVTKNLPTLLRAASLISRKLPNVRFAIACYKPHHADYVREKVKAWQSNSAPTLPPSHSLTLSPSHPHTLTPTLTIHHGQTADLIRQADCCIAVSGSVSLELLHYEKPTVIVFGLGRFWTAMGRIFLRIKYITLVNLLSDPDWFPERFRPFDSHTPPAKAPFPEYVGWRDFAPPIASHVVSWLTDPAAKNRVVRRLAELKTKFGQPGASARAAEYILRETKSKIARQATPRPHYVPTPTINRSAA